VFGRAWTTNAGYTCPCCCSSTVKEGNRICARLDLATLSVLDSRDNQLHQQTSRSEWMPKCQNQQIRTDCHVTDACNADAVNLLCHIATSTMPTAYQMVMARQVAPLFHMALRHEGLPARQHQIASSTPHHVCPHHICPHHVCPHHVCPHLAPDP
jgi:hypothetical protein